MSGGHVTPLAYFLGVIVILSAIVLLSILFEKFKEYLEHHVDKHMKPIIQSLFSELTLLGFIGLLLFITIQSGVLATISKKTHFAHGEEEDLHPGLALTHLIEYVHIVLFGVMVIFLFLVISLTFYGRRLVKEWGRLESICNREGHLSKKRDAPSEDEENEEGGVLDMWFSSFLEAHKSPARATYYAMRKRFIENCNDTKNVSDSGLVMEKNAVDGKFDFHEYLAISMGHILAEIIEIPVHTWLALEILFLGVLTVMLAKAKIRLIIITALGYFLVVCQFFVLRKLNWIKYMLLTPVRVAPRSSFRQSFKQARASNSHLLQEARDEPRYLKAMQSSTQLDTHFGTAGTPMHGHHEGAPHGHGFLARIYHRMFHHSASPFERLFWFGHHGPELLLNLVRFLLLLNSIYIAIVAVLPIIHALSWETNTHDVGLIVILYIVSFFAPAMFFVLVAKSLPLLVIVLNIEELSNQESINFVLRSMKTKKALGALKVLSAMKLACGDDDEEDEDEGVDESDHPEPEKSSDIGLVSLTSRASIGVEPVDTEHVKLADDASKIRTLLGALTHKRWMMDRKSQGWNYDPVQNDASKFHPDLMPFSMLPAASRQLYIDAADDLLKVIQSMGFILHLQDKHVDLGDLHDESLAKIVVASQNMTMTDLTIVELAEYIAVNAHLNWMKLKHVNGWTGGLDADSWTDARQAFDALPAQVQEHKCAQALIPLKYIIYCGYEIEKQIFSRPSKSAISGMKKKKKQAERSDIVEAFDKFKESNGLVKTVYALKAIHHMGWALPKHEHVSVMESLDKEGSGHVSLEKFRRWVLQKEATQNMDIKQVIKATFSRLDADGSGSITAGEFREALEGMGEDLDADDIQHIIHEADKDGDGNIDFEEFSALMSRMVSQG